MLMKIFVKIQINYIQKKLKLNMVLKHYVQQNVVIFILIINIIINKMNRVNYIYAHNNVIYIINF